MKERKRTLTTRTGIFGVMLLAMMMVSSTALAHTTELESEPGFWISDPDGVDGDNGIEQGDLVEGSAGSAAVTHDGAKIRVKATGLEPGHVYTMWVVYFNDSTLCDGGCNGPDLAVAGGGVIGPFAGTIGADDGVNRFVARLETGDGGSYVGPPPPPFAFAAYEAGPDNEFHVVIKSHGPIIEDILRDQLTTYSVGCDVNVGPFPEQVGDFPVPAAPGECGEIQVHSFR